MWGRRLAGTACACCSRYSTIWSSGVEQFLLVDDVVQLETILTTLSDVVWGPPMLALLVGTGVFLTLRIRGLQFTTLVPSLRLALIVRDEPRGTGDVSHYQALMTALAATVGTGNIAGVATAIAAGGPGALFWMWMTGLVGMATKFAEAVLAVQYRVTDDRHAMAGGRCITSSGAAAGAGWGSCLPA